MIGGYLHTNHKPDLILIQSNYQEGGDQDTMPTFLIFEYTFGTHLRQKVHILSTMENSYRYKHEIRFNNNQTHTTWRNLSINYRFNATWQLDKLMNKINLIPQFYHFSFIGKKSPFNVKWRQIGTQKVRISCKKWYTFSTHLLHFSKISLMFVF